MDYLFEVTRPLYFDGKRHEVGDVLRVADASRAVTLLESSRAKLQEEAQRASLSATLRNVNERQAQADMRAFEAGRGRFGPELVRY